MMSAKTAGGKVSNEASASRQVESPQLLAPRTTTWTTPRVSTPTCILKWTRATNQLPGCANCAPKLPHKWTLSHQAVSDSAIQTSATITFKTSQRSMTKTRPVSTNLPAPSRVKALQTRESLPESRALPQPVMTTLQRTTRTRATTRT